MKETRKLYVKSFGCQMNVYDSQRMADTLAPRGLCRDSEPRRRRSRHPQYLPHPREGGREGLFRARPRAPSEGRSRRAAGARHAPSRSPAASPRPKAKKFFAARQPSISWSGRKAIIACPDLLARAKRRRQAVDTEFPVDDKFNHLAAPSAAAMRARGASAFVTVQEGCDKFCTFCVVPYTRGMETSRPVDRSLPRSSAWPTPGVREVTLIGQNVNAYHGEGPDGRPDRWRGCFSASPKFPASTGCATPPAIRATWTTN